MTHQGVCGVVMLFNIHETPTRAVISARWLLVYCLQYRRSLADSRSVAGKGVNTDTPGLGYRREDPVGRRKKAVCPQPQFRTILI